MNEFQGENWVIINLQHIPRLNSKYYHHSFGNIYHKAYAPSLLQTGLLPQTNNLNNFMLIQTAGS